MDDTVIADIKEISWIASWKQSLACYNYCLSNCHRGRKLWRPQWNSDYYRQIKVLTTNSQNGLSCVALNLTCESIYCPQFFLMWFFFCNDCAMTIVLIKIKFSHNVTLMLLKLTSPFCNAQKTKCSPSGSSLDVNTMVIPGFHSEHPLLILIT